MRVPLAVMQSHSGLRPFTVLLVALRSPPAPGMALLWLGGVGVGVGPTPTALAFDSQVAVLNNHEELVQLLLDKGADAGVKNEVKTSALRCSLPWRTRKDARVTSFLWFSLLVRQRCPRDGPRL